MTSLDVISAVTMDNINEKSEGSNLSRTSAEIDKSTQVNEQKELKHSSSASIQPGRPSYLRKSSAWDNAFFTSAGNILHPSIGVDLYMIILCLIFSRSLLLLLEICMPKGSIELSPSIY